MASVFAHAVVPVVLYVAINSVAIDGTTVNNKWVNLRLLLLSVVLSMLPDADVIAFNLGISYESEWGHRGFTHSIAFSFLVAVLCACFSRFIRARWFVVLFVCFAACMSHALLDAMTNGGLGVALYWPFETQRHFFAFRPIEVSPIGVDAFFTQRGLHVIYSELIWVLLPASLCLLCVIILAKAFSRYFPKKKPLK